MRQQGREQAAVGNGSGKGDPERRHHPSYLHDWSVTVTAAGSWPCFQEAVFGFVLASDHIYVIKSCVTCFVAKRGSWVIGGFVYSVFHLPTHSHSPLQNKFSSNYENGQCSWRCAAKPLFLEDGVFWQFTWSWNFAYLYICFFPEGVWWVDESSMQCSDRYFYLVFFFPLSIKNSFIGIGLHWGSGHHAAGQWEACSGMDLVILPLCFFARLLFLFLGCNSFVQLV